MSIYTIQDWEKDGTFKALEGQEIDAAIYYEMRDVMPISPLRRPAYGCKNGFLSLEPAAHVNGLPVFMAFGSKDGRFYYLGLQ